MHPSVHRAVCIAGCVVALSACQAGRYQHVDMLMAEGCVIHVRGITIEVANDIKQRWDKSGDCDLLISDSAEGGLSGGGIDSEVLTEVVPGITTLLDGGVSDGLIENED